MKQAMRQVDTTIPLQADQSHVDLLQVCRSILNRLPIEIKWQWVESHQREKGMTNLDWWARKNDWCDNKAKAFSHCCQAQPQVPRDKRDCPHSRGETNAHTRGGFAHTDVWKTDTYILETSSTTYRGCPDPCSVGRCFKSMSDSSFAWVFINGMPSTYLVASPRHKFF
jgi:hypothetical protein